MILKQFIIFKKLTTIFINFYFDLDLMPNYIKDKLLNRIRNKKIWLVYSISNSKNCTSAYLLKKLKTLIKKKNISGFLVTKKTNNEKTCFHVFLTFEKCLDTVNPGYFDLELKGSLVRPEIKPTGSKKKVIEYLSNNNDIIVSDNLKIFLKKRKSSLVISKGVKKFRIHRKKIYLIYKNIKQKQFTKEQLLLKLLKKKKVVWWVICKVEHNEEVDFHALLIYKDKLDISSNKFFDVEFNNSLYHPVIEPVGSIKEFLKNKNNYNDFIISKNLKFVWDEIWEKTVNNMSLDGLKIKLLLVFEKVSLKKLLYWWRSLW